MFTSVRKNNNPYTLQITHIAPSISSHIVQHSYYNIAEKWVKRGLLVYFQTRVVLGAVLTAHLQWLWRNLPGRSQPAHWRSPHTSFHLCGWWAGLCRPRGTLARLRFQGQSHTGPRSTAGCLLKWCSSTHAQIKKYNCTVFWSFLHNTCTKTQCTTTGAHLVHNNARVTYN